MKANGASIVGDERTTPLFRQVPEEVKRRGLRAAGGGEGCWRTLDHGSAALQWAVVDGGRRGQWGGRSGEARPAPAGSCSQWALPSHLEHPLSIHWAATTGGTCWRCWGGGPPLQPAPHAEREANHAPAASAAGHCPHCGITVRRGRGSLSWRLASTRGTQWEFELCSAPGPSHATVRPSRAHILPPHHGFDEPPLANTPHSQHAHKRRRP